MIKETLFLIFILISCSRPYYRFDEILVVKTNLKTEGTNRYIKIKFKDSRIFSLENYKTLNYGYIFYEFKRIDIPKGYRKIKKNDVLKIEIKMAKHDDGHVIHLFGPPVKKGEPSFEILHLFECDIILNGYLPDSCFVNR